MMAKYLNSCHIWVFCCCCYMKEIDRDCRELYQADFNLMFISSIIVHHFTSIGGHDTNSLPTGILIGVWWRRKVYLVRTAQLWYSMAESTEQLWNCSIVLQLNYEAAQLWNSRAVRWPWGQAALGLNSSSVARQLCSALPVLLCFALHQSTTFWSGKSSLVIQLQLGKRSFQSLVERGSLLSKPEGVWLI